jgi:hypothetical protein
MTSLPPWANGPFELLVHAEGHLGYGEDFDLLSGEIRTRGRKNVVQARSFSEMLEHWNRRKRFQRNG